MKLVKIVGILVVTVVVVLAVLIAALMWWIDPNDYKERISQVVEQNSGYRLTLSGDLSWSFYPVLGFRAGETALASSSAGEDFAQFQEVEIGVQLIPLFSKQLKVDSLILSGLNADLVVSADGVPNWQPVTEPDEEAEQGNTQQNPDQKNTETPDQQKEVPLSQNPLLKDLEIPLIAIEEAQVRYRDLQAGSDFGVQIDSLTLHNVSLTKPFKMALELSLTSGGEGAADAIKAALQGDMQLSADLDHQRYQITELGLDFEVNGATPEPVSGRLEAEVSADLASDSAQINVTRLLVEQQELSLTMSVEKLTAEPRFNGKFDLAASDIRPLLARAGVELPPMAVSRALSSVGASAVFQGSTEQVSLQPLDITIDQSRITGQASVLDFATQAAQFDLTLDRIVLDDYMPPPSEEGETAATSTGAGDKAGGNGEGNEEQGELIPVETLQTLNLDGRLRVNQMIAQKIEFNNLEVQVNAKNGLVSLSQVDVDTLGGTIRGNAQVDARTQTPVLKTQFKVSALDVGTLVQQFADLDVVSGALSFDLNATSRGNDMDTLMQQGVGQFNMDMAQGMLHGININNIVVDALHEQLAKLESLYPDYRKYVPRELKEDTRIEQFSANARLENGKLITPDIDIALENGAIDANGSFDLLQMGFDYQLGVGLAAIDRNKYLKGTLWPVNCKGSLDTAASDWCRPDTRQMQNILNNAAKQALKGSFQDKGAQKIGEKLGVDAETQDQLEDQLKDKVKEEEDRAKDKLKNRLQDLLKR